MAKSKELTGSANAFRFLETERLRRHLSKRKYALEVLKLKNPQLYRHWEQRGVPLANLTKLAKCLGGVSVEELETGHLLPKDLSATSRETPSPSDRTTIGQAVYRGSEPKTSMIPLFTWAQVRDWHEISSAHSSTTTPERVAAAGTFGPRTFGLHVCGDAMEPAFREGDTIIVDPDRVPKGGDYVIVIGKPSAEPTFKQLIIEVDDQRYLKPANRRYPLVPVTQEMTIVGVVVMKMRVY